MGMGSVGAGASSSEGFVISYGKKTNYIEGDAVKQFGSTDTSDKSFNLFVSSVQVLSHVNCYNVCDVIFVARDCKSKTAINDVKALAGLVGEMAKNIGKKFEVKAEETKVFTGLLSSVSLVLGQDVEYAPPDANAEMNAFWGDEHVVKATFVSSIQRLETVWRPRSWVDSMRCKDDKDDKVEFALADDGINDLNIMHLIDSIIKSTNKQPEISYCENSEFDGCSTAFAQALWPSYMNAFDYLVNLCESNGIVFRVDMDDKVQFKTGKNDVSLNSDNTIALDVTDGFSFINSASAYSFGARLDLRTSDLNVGVKRRAYAEGMVTNDPSADVAPVKLSFSHETGKRLSRYLDTAAGTTSSSVDSKLRSSMRAGFADCGTIYACINIAESGKGKLTGIMHDMSNLVSDEAGQGTKYAVTSACFIAADGGAFANRIRLYVKGNELPHDLPANDKEGNSSIAPETKLFYSLAPEKNDGGSGSGSGSGA